MTEEEPIVMSAEQLWAANDEEEIEKYRGEPREITDFDHKIARDMRDFAKNLDTVKLDNEVRVHTNAHEEYNDDEEFYDIVHITYPSK